MDRDLQARDGMCTGDTARGEYETRLKDTEENPLQYEYWLRNKVRFRDVRSLLGPGGDSASSPTER